MFTISGYARLDILGFITFLMINDRWLQGIQIAGERYDQFISQSIGFVHGMTDPTRDDNE
jgi:hypothetical protein